MYSPAPGNDQRRSGGGPNGGPNRGNRNNNGNLFGMILGIIAVISSLVMFTMVSKEIQDTAHQEITYNEFLDMIDAGEIKSVKLRANEITIIPMEQPVEMMEWTTLP